jgi:hypothetical protein
MGIAKIEATVESQSESSDDPVIDDHSANNLMMDTQSRKSN